jgi:nucleotide-binding universal stress UspA family protein
MYQTILVPWDGSALSETAFAMAVPIARRHKARVQIVRVRQPPPLVGQAPMYDTRLDSEQGDRVRSEEQALAERLSKDSGVVVDAEAVFPTISALITPDEATLALLRVVTPLSPSNAQMQIDPFTEPPKTFSIETDTAEASAYLANVAKSLGQSGIRATGLSAGLSTLRRKDLRTDENGPVQPLAKLPEQGPRFKVGVRAAPGRGGRTQR